MDASKNSVMIKGPARYEFRVWAQDLAEIRKKLGDPDLFHKVSSNETYLISRTTDRCNAKLRSAIMDIKVLTHTDRGLEQWEPVLKAGFPLDAAVIASQIFPRLELEAPALSRAQYSIEEFLGEVIGPQAAIVVVDVSKRRVQFNLDACRAEFASVVIKDAALETLAIEALDPEAVLTQSRAVGLNPNSNTSYVRAIKQVIGL
jgi:exopolyphosphatase/guanosine-5'-triphosphate,3'-diphosphate pyrophosphatase